MANSFGANFTVDVSDLKTKLREANTAIRETESSFRASAAQVDSWSDSAGKVQERIDSLNTIIGYQKDKVKALKENYEKLVSEGLDETSEKASKLRTQINKEEEALNKNTTEVEKNKNQLKKLATQEDKTETETKELTTEVDKSTQGWTVMKGALSDLVSQGIQKAISGFKDLATGAVDSFVEVDEGYKNLIKATGATGDSAEGLESTYKSVSKQVKGDFGDIGRVVGEVNTQFGYTNDELEDASIAFIKFAEITGQDGATAVKLVSQALNKANIDTKSYKTVLDALTTASQRNGVEAGKVTEALSKYGTTAKSLGFTVNDTIAILSTFEKEGVNTEQAMKGLEKATRNWTKQGLDARTEFEKVVDDIKAAPDDISAGQEAIKAFGDKAGLELANAFRTSKTDYSEFIKELNNSTGTIESTYTQITNGFDTAKIALQDFKVEMSELVDDFVNEYGPEIAGVIKSIPDALRWLKGKFKEIGDDIIESTEDIVNAGIEILNVIPGVDIDPVDWTGRKSDYTNKFESTLRGVINQGQDLLNSGKMYADLTNELNGMSELQRNVWRQNPENVKRQQTAYQIFADSLTKATSGSNVINSHYDYQEQQKQKAREAGLGVTINQTNYYSKEKSRYELYQAEQNILSSVKVGLAAR